MSSPIVQYLQHGKALCGSVFRAFVETFNWHNDFCVNLKGDGDFSEFGKIKLDRTDQSNPVIRCKGCTNSESEGEGVDVVTDVDLDIDTSGSTPKLVLKKTVTKIKAIKVETSEEPADPVVAAELTLLPHSYNS